MLRPAELAEMQRTVPSNKDWRAFWPGFRYGLGLMRIQSSCGEYRSHGGDVMGYTTRNGISADGKRSVMITINTDSMERRPGAPVPVGEITNQLIDNALCP